MTHENNANVDVDAEEKPGVRRPCTRYSSFIGRGCCESEERKCCVCTEEIERTEVLLQPDKVFNSVTANEPANPIDAEAELRLLLVNRGSGDGPYNPSGICLDADGA